MQSRKVLYRLSYLPALALCGAFLSTINPFSKELSMVKKTTSKFIIAFLSLSFLGLTLWHCKKNNSPTAPRTSPDLIPTKNSELPASYPFVHHQSPCAWCTSETFLYIFKKVQDKLRGFFLTHSSKQKYRFLPL